MRGLCAKHYKHDLDERRARGELISGLVDPGPAREHVAALRAMGMSYRRIGELCGMHPDAVRATTHRFHRITAQGAARLLAVSIPAKPHEQAYSGHRLSAVGTMRRLQALIAIGHSQREIAHKLGVLETNLFRLVNGNQTVVTAERARQVEAIYDAMSTAPGHCTRALRKAQRRNYAPPMAWEGLEIDDPDARPGPWRPARVSRRRRLPTDWLEMLVDWRGLGRSDDEIAAALGIELESLMRRLDRAGLPRNHGRPSAKAPNVGSARIVLPGAYALRGAENRPRRTVHSR